MTEVGVEKETAGSFIHVGTLLANMASFIHEIKIVTYVPLSDIYAIRPLIRKL